MSETKKTCFNHITCYPKVFYFKPQHSYKLGAHASKKMYLAKIIMNKIR